MTLEDALGLRVGDYVVSGLTAKPWRPCRVAAVWVNAIGERVRSFPRGGDITGAIVRVRLPSIEASAWLDPVGFELPSVRFRGQKWCRQCGVWETKADKRERHGNDRSFRADQMKGMATSLREWSRKNANGDPGDGDSIE